MFRQFSMCVRACVYEFFPTDWKFILLTNKLKRNTDFIKKEKKFNELNFNLTKFLVENQVFFSSLDQTMKFHNLAHYCYITIYKFFLFVKLNLVPGSCC